MLSMQCLEARLSWLSLVGCFGFVTSIVPYVFMSRTQRSAGDSRVGKTPGQDSNIPVWGFCCFIAASSEV